MKINLENYPLLLEWLKSGDSENRTKEFERLMATIAQKVIDRKTDLPSANKKSTITKPS